MCVGGVGGGVGGRGGMLARVRATEVYSADLSQRVSKTFCLYTPL